jgi:hypothetical protein
MPAAKRDVPFTYLHPFDAAEVPPSLPLLQPLSTSPSAEAVLHEAFSNLYPGSVAWMEHTSPSKICGSFLRRNRPCSLSLALPPSSAPELCFDLGMPVSAHQDAGYVPVAVATALAPSVTPTSKASPSFLAESQAHGLSISSVNPSFLAELCGNPE